MKKRVGLKSAILGGVVSSLFLSQLGLSAPMLKTEKLPIDKEFIEALKKKNYTEEQITEFVIELNKIEFYPDHANPLDLSKRGEVKTFYSAPFLAPNPARDTVGADMIANYALDVINATDKLVLNLDLNLYRVEELKRELEDLTFRKKKYEKQIADARGNDIPNNEERRKAITELEKQINNTKASIDKEINSAASSSSSLGSLGESVINQVVYQLSRVGFVPNEEENRLLRSSNKKDVINGLSNLRARVANGQMALRQLTLESGLNPALAKIFGIYRELRPDVKISSVGFSKLYVKPAAETSINKTYAEGVLIRDVNKSSKSPQGRGECGNSKACSVVIEFTAIGAMNLLTAGSAGAIINPVTFSGDVQISEPDFKGSYDCKFKNGWWAKGRADVKDGGIIYDGDVTNKIKYESENVQEYCGITIERGDKGAAAWQILHDLETKYQILFDQRTIMSKKEKDGYRQHVESELQRHATQSQNRNETDYMSSVYAWASGSMGGWQAAAVTVVSQARDFYWHTRIEDTSSFDKVEIHKKFDYSNVTSLKELSFDAYAISCTKLDGAVKKIVACDQKTAQGADTMSGIFADNCDPSMSLDTCQRGIEGQTSVNESGLVEI